VKKRRSFIVSSHANRQEGEAALAALEELGREGTIQLADAAIVVRTNEGRVELYQRHELSIGEGAVGGGTAGILAGLLLGVPIAGPVLGVAVGVGLGAIDRGIDDGRMRRVGAELHPGQAALCVLVGEADWPAVRERMAPLVGELLVTELTPEAEEALREAQAQGQA
jgi:uncharacterized membrane protein